MKKIINIIIVVFIILFITSGCNRNFTSEVNKQTTTHKETNELVAAPESEDENKEIENNFNNITNLTKERFSERQEETAADQQIYYSPFSGKRISEPLLRRAVAAIIENSPAARPQSGLEAAPLVYEFLVEGGITRFLALYWDQIPDEIGPIRSLRPYLINTASEYNPLLLHAGASPEGFSLLSKIDITNLDQIYNGKYYWRSNERRVPHNLYTGYFKIKDYLNNLTGQEYIPRFSFEPITIIQDGDTRADEIIINYWGDYRVLYKYDSRQNHYKRYLNEFTDPHLVESGKQITANNIIVQYAETEIKDEVGRLEIDIEGNGKALFFKNGIVIEGSWENKDDEWTKFYDENGSRITLKPGKTWIQVVPASAVIKYQESNKQESDNNEKRD